MALWIWGNANTVDATGGEAFSVQWWLILFIFLRQVLLAFNQDVRSVTGV